jgi:two-component system, chemotaxis family, chemotaxis protein CheY
MDVARVLIADDSPFMKQKLKQLVEESGYEFAGEAATAEETLSLIADTKPELIIMDITMPDMNGIDSIRTIKELKPDTKIIICSAIGQQEVIVSAIQAGANDFIVKPFFDGRVITALTGLLS